MVGTRAEPISPDCAVTVDIHIYVYANGVRMTFTVPSYCLVSADFSSFWDLLAVQALFLYGNDPFLGTVSGVQRRSYPYTVFPLGTNLDIQEGVEYDVLLSPMYAMNITNSVVVGTSAAVSAVSMTCDVILGYQAAMAMQYGNSNVLLGCDVAGGSTSGNNNVYLGAAAGYYTNGSNNIFLGFGAGYNLSSANNTLIIGLCSDAFLHGDMTTRVLTVSGETHSRAVGIESLKLTRTVSGNLYYDDSVANISGHVYTEDYPPPGTLPNLFYTTPDRVGINTASPSTQLDVSGALYVSSGATISGNLDVYGDISCTTLYATVSSVYLGTLQLSRNPSGFLFLNDSTANVSGVVYSGGDPATGNFTSAVISSNLSAGSLTVSGDTTTSTLNVLSTATFSSTANLSSANVSGALTVLGLGTFSNITSTGNANLFNVNISGTTTTSTLNVINANLNINNAGTASLFLNSSASPNSTDVVLTNNGVAWSLVGNLSSGIEGNSIGGNVIAKTLNFAISGERYITMQPGLINISAAAPLTVRSTATFNSNVVSTGTTALSNVNISGTLNTVGLGTFSNLTSTGSAALSNVNISGTLNTDGLGTFSNLTSTGNANLSTLNVSGSATLAALTISSGGIAGINIVNSNPTGVNLSLYTTGINWGLTSTLSNATTGITANGTTNVMRLTVSGDQSLILAPGLIQISGGSVLNVLSTSTFSNPANLSSANVSGALTVQGLGTFSNITSTGNANLSNVNISGTTTTSILNVLNADLNINNAGAASLYLNSSASPYGADVYLTNNGTAWALAGSYNNAEGNSIGGNTVSRTLNFSISGERYITMQPGSINISAAAPLTVRSTATFNSNVTSIGTAALSNVNISGTLNTVGLGTFSNLTSTGTAALSNVNISGTLTTVGQGTFANLTSTGNANLSNVNISGTLNTVGQGTFANLTSTGTSRLSNVSISGTLTTVGQGTFANLTATGATNLSNLNASAAIVGKTSGTLETFLKVNGQGDRTYISGQGAYLSWNNTAGGGRTDIGCQRGGGGGGFDFTIYDSNNAMVNQPILATATNVTLSSTLTTTGTASFRSNVNISSSLSISGSYLFVGGTAGYSYVGTGNTAGTGQGTYISWNNSSSIGATEFVCQKGGGLGGFIFSVADSNAVTTNVARIDGAGNYAALSDRRLKEDIQDLNTQHSYERILSLHPKSYVFAMNAESGKRNVGFIAQEVEEVNPHCLVNFYTDDVPDVKGLCYNDLFIHAIGAIQEQAKQIKKMQDALVTLGIDICSL